KAEVGSVARDVPVREPLLEELFELLRDAGVQKLRPADEIEQKVLVLGQLEEEMARRSTNRRAAADHAAPPDELRWGVRLSAPLAHVPVLVGRLAVGAGAPNEAVWQEALVGLAVRLLDLAPGDVARRLDAFVAKLGVLLVLR